MDAESISRNHYGCQHVVDVVAIDADEGCLPLDGGDGGVVGERVEMVAGDHEKCGDRSDGNGVCQAKIKY